jgi:serine/threonine protein phosphatase PrpC
VFSARVKSNYPLTEESAKLARLGTPLRDLAHSGDPVCDQYMAKIIGTRVIVALCDGCNWGPQPLEAAQRSCSAFVDYLARNQHKIYATEDAGDMLVLATNAADEAIIANTDSPMNAGTTTMIAGMLLELAPEDTAEGKYAFVCASVGDCKAMCYNKGLATLEDITATNRTNLCNQTDPGGRLGPHFGNGRCGVK